MIEPVAFSLGSNLGDREAFLKEAVRKLTVELGGARVSSLFETEAVEVAESQPAYLNVCVAGESDREPRELLALCARIEGEAGRSGGHLEPRVLDVDLLLLGDRQFDEPDLVLPHRGLAQRRFVLAPLAELMADWAHPADGRTVKEMLGALGTEQEIRLLRSLKDWWNG